jgi:hypothetical protein
MTSDRELTQATQIAVVHGGEREWKTAENLRCKFTDKSPAAKKLCDSQHQLIVSFFKR